jgi:hypothetical protein
MSHAEGKDFLTRSAVVAGGDGRRVFQVGVRCRKCGVEEWRVAKNPGWGRRIFKDAGWSIGNMLSQHTCPDCIASRHNKPREEQPTAQVLQFPTSCQPCPDLPPTPAPEPELGPIPQTPLTPPQPVREIPSSPTAIQETPMAQTALAEALAPIKQQHDRKRHMRESKGTPHGYATVAAARTGAWRSLRHAGVAGRIICDVHYKLEKAPDGTYSYVLLNSTVAKPAIKSRRLKAHEGQRLVEKSSAVNQAKIVCERLGISKPIEDIHFKITREGGGWIYKILPAAEVAPDLVSKESCMAKEVIPPRICGGGFLSRFDARKDALAKLQPLRKAGGVPLEGVDYWIAQDGYNLWSWTTEKACDAPAPQMMSDASTQAVRDAEEAAKTPKAEEPRKATPADNRRIMEKLDERYSVEHQSYFAGYDDRRLAEMLNLPRAWVAKVREEFYGPERNAEAETAAKVAKLDAAISKGEAVISKSQDALDLYAEIETLVAELKKVRAEIGR